MMTRQHYEAIADILGRRSASADMVTDFITFLHSDNPRFDHVRFESAIAETEKKTLLRA